MPEREPGHNFLIRVLQGVQARFNPPPKPMEVGGIGRVEISPEAKQQEREEFTRLFEEATDDVVTVMKPDLGS